MGCVQVVCKFTVDNEVAFAMYDNKSLTISGGDLYDWQVEKEISFESCDVNNPGILAIKGKRKYISMDEALYEVNWVFSREFFVM